MDLKKIVQTLNTVDVYSIVREVVLEKEVQDLFLSLNKRQMWEGEQVDGSPLESTNNTPGVYSKTTEEFNEGIDFYFEGESKRKIAGDPYFLLDEGIYFDSMLVEVFNDSFLIDALKFRGDTNMIKEYGNILGLNKANFEKVSIVILTKVLHKLITKFDK